MKGAQIVSFTAWCRAHMASPDVEISAGAPYARRMTYETLDGLWMTDLHSTERPTDMTQPTEAEAALWVATGEWPDGR